MKKIMRGCGVYLVNDIMCFDSRVKTPKFTRICGPVYSCMKTDGVRIVQNIKMSLDNFSFNHDDDAAAKLWEVSSKQLYKIIGVRSERAKLKIARRVLIAETDNYLELTPLRFDGDFRGSSRLGDKTFECSIDSSEFTDKLFEAFSCC
jgi:hypothetical protein